MNHSSHNSFSGINNILSGSVFSRVSSQTDLVAGGSVQEGQLNREQCGSRCRWVVSGGLSVLFKP